MLTAYIALGSNIEPEKNTETALQLLARELTINTVSPFYWSDPVGPAGNVQFLNGIIEILTRVSPMDLKMHILQPIEKKLGRIRTNNKYAPRTIDLDLIVYDGLINLELNLPDSDIFVREFLARPLCDINPSIIIEGQELQSIALLQRESTLKLNKEFSNHMQEMWHVAKPLIKFAEIQAHQH